MEKCSTQLKPVNQIETIDRGHGRLDQRAYFQYDISDQHFDVRWASSKFKSLIDYFKAIRNHWSVETTNHIRDVTLQEDQLRTKKNQ